MSPARIAAAVAAWSVALAPGCGGGKAAAPAAPLAYEEPSDPDGSDPASATPAQDAPREDAAASDDGVASTPTVPAGGALPAEAQAILQAHNRQRAQHCARPLAWSADLAATAQTWADALRDNGCAFEHSQTAYGENLAAGTQLSAANAVALWTSESSKYSFQRPGFSMATGHFTQVIWVGTRSVGCGSSECQGMRLWVCHYDPPGNVLSLFPDNVLPPTCK